MPKGKGAWRGCFLRGGRWRYQRRLSPTMAEALGKQNIIVNLQTSDARVAAERAKDARRAVDNMIAEAKKSFKKGRSDIEMAKTLAEAYAATIEYPVEDWLEEVEARKGYDYAYEMSHIVFGRKKLISDLLDERFAAEPVGAKAERDIRFAMGILEDYTGARFVEDVDRQAAIKFADRLLSEGTRSRSTIKKIIQRVSSVFNFAVKRGYIESSPFIAVHIKGDGDTDLRPPTSEELKLLLDNAQGRLRAAVRVFARTGLRLGELVALEPEDVYDGFIRIHRGKTKAAKRIVPVHSCIKADLENWLMKPMGRSALTRNFAELRDSLGISSDVTLHGLRKYVYAELISKEPRAFLVSRLVGHTVPAMMKVYGGLGSPKDLKEVIDKLDDL